jgi:hypothetical protein
MREALAFLLLVPLALAAPVSAQAAWTAPFDLGTGGVPNVGVDGDGNALFAWDASCCYIQARVRSAAGALGAPETISPPGQYAPSPQVAVDQRGNAVFAWLSPDGTTDCSFGQPCFRVQARARSAAGGLSETQTLSPAHQNASFQQIAVDQSGDAVFVWLSYDQTGCGGSGCIRVLARARSAAGDLSPIQTLGKGASAEDGGFPQVAVDQSGDAVFVWSVRDETTDCLGKPCLRVQARARSAAGTLSATQTLSAAGRSAKLPDVGIDRSGNAVFAWQRGDETMDCGGHPCLRVQIRARSAVGTLSATQTLSAAGQPAGYPQVAVDKEGDAVFVWRRLDGTNGCLGYPGCNQIQAIARSAAGARSPIQSLSVAGLNAELPQVAVDQGGNAVFVWLRRDGTSDCGGYPGCWRVQARARGAAGDLSGTQTLSAAGQTASLPHVAVNPDGNAAAVWTLSYTTVQGATGP